MEVKPESHEANLLAANALAANKFANSLSVTGYSLANLLAANKVEHVQLY